MQPIQLLDLKLDAAQASSFLESCPYWNLFKERNSGNSPHRETDDIWAHWGDPTNPKVRRNEETYPMHWYYLDLKRVLEPLIEALMAHVKGRELGLVLITRIPAGKQVYPHKDYGYNQRTFSKYCIAAKANKEQVFKFKEAELKCNSSDVFWFRNDLEHSVSNPSKEDRISIIVCIRTERGIEQP